MPALQTSYGNVLQPAVPGMIADMRNRTVLSRVAQIGPVAFGVPSFRGTADNTMLTVGATGAGAFEGITVRDPTVRPLVTYPDTFQQYDIVPVLIKGIVWVRVVSPVTPGQAALLDGAGNFTALSGTGYATDAITFTTNPAAGQTITLNGTTVTFVASGATGNQVNIGASLSATLTSLLTLLQASADTQIVKFTYNVTTNSQAPALELTAATAGTGGNALTVASTVAGATVLTPTLTGGDAANTAISATATFESTAVAGALAKLRL